MAPNPQVTRWSSLIQLASKRYGVAPRVLAAVIEHESGGQEGLTSSAGAKGLTQFMPGTARTYHVNTSPGHAKSQILGEAHYLSDLGFKRNPTKALASYAAGPGNVPAGLPYADAVLKLARKYTDLRGGGPAPQTSPPVAKPSFDQQGFDQATIRAQILTQLLSHGNPNTDNPLVRFGLLQPDRASFQVGQPKPSAPAVKTAVRTPTGSAKGLFRVTGANPGRLKAPLIAFAERVASVYGQPITGDSGATHSRLTVNGNVSQHWTGNATDIPATGKRLIALGRAALVAAGMPPAQAAKQTGGLFNFAHGVQVIFNTMQGGNHYTHLHISHG